MTKKINGQKLQVSSIEEKRSDGLVPYLVLTYGLMVLTWGILAIFQMSVATVAETDAAPSAIAMTLYMLGGFTPSIVGIFMAWRAQGRDGLREMWSRSRQFNLGSKWYLVIVGLPAIIFAGRILMFAIGGGEIVRPAFMEQPVSILFIAITLFIGGSLSEEFGWRGFAQDRAMARWGEMSGSMTLGLFWGVWHMMLFFIPGTFQQQMGNPVVMFPAFVVYVVSMTILFTWIYTRTNRSIWGALLFHFTINFSNVMFYEFANGEGEVEHLISTGIMIVIAVVVITVTRFDLKNKMSNWRGIFANS